MLLSCPEGGLCGGRNYGDASHAAMTNTWGPAGIKAPIIIIYNLLNFNISLKSCASKSASQRVWVVAVTRSPCSRRCPAATHLTESRGTWKETDGKLRIFLVLCGGNHLKPAGRQNAQLDRLKRSLSIAQCLDTHSCWTAGPVERNKPAQWLHHWQLAKLAKNQNQQPRQTCEDLNREPTDAYMCLIFTQTDVTPNTPKKSLLPIDGNHARTAPLRRCLMGIWCWWHWGL